MLMDALQNKLLYNALQNILYSTYLISKKLVLNNDSLTRIFRIIVKIEKPCKRAP